MTDVDATAEEILSVLKSSAGDQYFGEAVTKLEHAEQCAWHAEQAGADEELVLAALLHDVGHLLDTPETLRDERVGVINHDEIGEQWVVEHGLSPRIAALVGGHVDAKRYLTATNAAYFDRLSPASKETLRLQGGPMEPADADAFSQDPHLNDKLRLRGWDEMAKDPRWTGPGADCYREMLVRALRGYHNNGNGIG